MQPNDNEKCPVCDIGILSSSISNDTLKTPKGNILIENCVIIKCPICYSSFYDQKTTHRIDNLLKKKLRKESI